MTSEQIAEGRRLLDALREEGTPDEWLIGNENDEDWMHLYARHRLYNPDDGAYAEWSEYVARSVKPADAALIVWARNNLPALLDALDDAECESERLRLRLSRLRSPKRARQTLDSTGDANRQRRPHARTSTPANEPACPSLEDLERARATIDRVLKLIDEAEQSPSRGVQFGGTPFPASVGTDQLRAALDGDQ